MIDFDIAIPTKIYFGRNKENLIGDILQEYAFKNALIIIGQSSVRKSRLLDKVLLSLDKKS